MEKFRIAQYGFIQMVALAYGVLSAGATVKISKQFWTDVSPPPVFGMLSFYRDYGLWLSLIILGWAAFCAFHATIYSKRNIDENKIVASGLILSGIFFVLGTIALLGGIANMFPPVSLHK